MHCKRSLQEVQQHQLLFACQARLGLPQHGGVSSRHLDFRCCDVVAKVTICFPQNPSNACLQDDDDDDGETEKDADGIETIKQKSKSRANGAGKVPVLQFPAITACKVFQCALQISFIG